MKRIIRSSLLAALAGIGLRPIGGFRTAQATVRRSRYHPHQGEQECARRRGERKTRESAR